ncbi:hypothetical protein HT118_03175 [Escherichia coli]|nr:hypothetical protein [Escherichia coli]
MSAQAHVRESESSSGSFISRQFLVWQVMFVIGVVAGMNPGTRIQFSRLMGGSVNLNKQFFLVF